MMQTRLKSKRIQAIIALAIAAVLVLSGAFAWYTFSQNRINTFELLPSAPNVNLHDDFAGGPEKDVYVENSGDFNVLVRVRLSELIKRGNDLTPANAVDTDEALGWHVHTPSADGCDTCGFEAHNYFDWTMYGQKFYMPAHNSAKGSDSVEPIAVGDKETVIDYAALLKDAFTEIYASDQNALDNMLALMDAYLGGDDTIAAELMEAIASIPDTYTISVKQYAEQPEREYLRRLNEVRLTLVPSQIITMQDWITGATYGTPLSSGDFWVMDSDGWCYWANALAPNAATGQLLSEVNYHDNYSGEDFTYKINVHLNATSLDGTSLATFFLIAEQNGGVSDEAMILMFLASGEYIFGEDSEIYHNEGGGFYRKINKNNGRYVNYTLGEKVYAQPGSLPGSSGGLSVGGQLGLDEDGNVTDSGDYVIEAIVPGENGVVYLDVGGGVYIAPVDENGNPDNSGEKYAIVHTGTDGQTGNDDDIGPVRAEGSFPQWYFVDITDVSGDDVIEAGQKGTLIRANDETEVPVQTFSVQKTVYRVQSITRGENGLLYLKLDEDLYAVAFNAYADPVNLTMSEVWGVNEESGEPETVSVPSTYYIVYPSESGKIGTENDTTDITPVISAQPVSISGVYGDVATTLSVTASGAGVHTYQWYKDGAPIAGAVSNTLEVPDVADSGSYYCTVTADVKGHSSASIDTDTVTVSITKRTITITADSDEKVYDGGALTHNSYTVTSGSLAVGDSLDVTCTGTITDVGMDENVISATTITRAEHDVTANYTVTTVDGTLSVTKRPITITAGSASKDYDGTPLTENSYTISGTLASGETLSVTVTGSIVDFGTEENVIFAYTIMRSGTDVTENYNVTTVKGVLTVAQQTLTITAGSTSKVYDGTPLTYSNYTTSGALASGDILSVTVTGSRTDAGTSPNTVTAYTITRLGVDVTASYTVTTVNGSLTVSAKPLTATMLNVTGTYIYTGVAQPPTYTVIDGAPLTNGIHYHNVTVTNHTNAGTAKIEITGIGNYQGTVSKNFTIEKAPLTVTAVNKSVIYSNAAPANGVIYSGFVNGQTQSVLTGTLAYDCAYTTASNVGDYDIMPKGLTAANYNITFAKGTLTVTPKSLIAAMLAVNGTYTYTGSAQTPTVTVTDGVALTFNTHYNNIIATNSTNAGTASVSVTGIGNYQGTVSKNFTISPKPLTDSMLTVSGTYTYTGSAQTPTVTVTDGSTLINGTHYNNVKGTNNINAGTASVSVTGIGNYTGTATKSFTISPKSLTDSMLTVNGTYTYTGSAQTPAVTVTDGSTLINGTHYTNVKGTNNINAGTASVSVTGIGNYTGTATKSFTISPKSLTAAMLTVNGTYTYTGSAQTPTVTVTDGSTLINGTHYNDVKGTNNINAGTTASVSVTGIGNYQGTVSKNFTIAQKALTITANNQTITYLDAIPNYSVSYNGFVGGQSASNLGGTLSYTCTYTATSNATTYSITPKGLTSTNYAIEFKTGTLTVNRKALSAATVVNVTSSHTYSGSAQTPTFTVSDGGTGLTVTTNYTASYSNNTNAGTATITLTGVGNYQGTVTRNFTIDKRVITITSSNSSKTYDGTPLTLSSGTVTSGTLASGDTLSSVTTSGTITNAGTVPNTISSYSIMRSGNSMNANYTVTTASGSLTVNKRAITITSSNSSKTYDGTPLTLSSGTVTSGSLASGDTLSTVTTSGTITNAGTVPNTISSYSIMRSGSSMNANYTVTTATGTLTVNKRALTITASSTSKTYDGTALTYNNYSSSGLASGSSFSSVTVSGTITNAGETNNTISAYTIMHSGANANANYEVTTVNGKLTVNKRPITLTAGSASKEYDGTEITNSSYTLTSGTFASGEGLTSVTVTGSNNNGGTVANVITAYTIMRSSTNVTSNYNVSTVNGTLTLTHAYAGGRGTLAEPFLITTRAQFEYMRDKVNTYAAAYSTDKHFRQTANINLGGGNWTPIGPSGNGFNGVYDGNGYKVSGLYINSSSMMQGLFGILYLGTIKNLAVEGNVTSSSGNIGGIVGYVSTATISNCVFSGTVTSTSGTQNQVGGIIGAATSNVTIENCYVTYGSEVKGYLTVGGIVGRTESNVKNCYSLAALTGTTFPGGGVVGYNNGGTVTNCAFLRTASLNSSLSAVFQGNGTNTSVGYFASSGGALTATNSTTISAANLLALLQTGNPGIWRSDSGGVNNGYPVLVIQK